MGHVVVDLRRLTSFRRAIRDTPAPARPRSLNRRIARCFGRTIFSRSSRCQGRATIRATEPVDASPRQPTASGRFDAIHVRFEYVSCHEVLPIDCDVPSGRSVALDRDCDKSRDKSIAHEYRTAGPLGMTVGLNGAHRRSGARPQKNQPLPLIAVFGVDVGPQTRIMKSQLSARRP
jgi:hypothetical protein